MTRSSIQDRLTPGIGLRACAGTFTGAPATAGDIAGCLLGKIAYPKGNRR